MRPAVSHIPYAKSSHEQTVNNINFEQFEEDDLEENERNTEEYEFISTSIDESYTNDDSDDGSISTNYLKDISDGIQIHPKINARYSRLKICDRIKKKK